MKKKLLLLGTILLLCSLLAGCSQQAQQTTSAKKKIIVGTVPGFYPFQMMDKNGDLIGYNIDIARDLGEYLGGEVEFKGYNGVADLISALQADQVEILISGVTITDKRKETVDFSIPYFESNLNILLNNKYKDVKGWEELDRPDVNVAVVLGSTGDEMATKIFKHAKINRFDTTALAGQEVLNGKAAAMLQDDTWTNIYQMYNSDKTSILTMPKIGRPSEFGIVVAKGNKELLDKINAFLKQYKESGAEAKTYAKWFKSDSWKEIVPPKK